MKRFNPILPFVFFGICLFPTFARAADNPAALLAESGVGGGLVIHVGSTDGALEATLAQAGTFLIHGLLKDASTLQKARNSLIEKEVYGLASIHLLRDSNKLPYASNLAAAVIADLDALGSAAPSREEFDRVTSPGGVLILKTNGKWSVEAKARPAAVDHWSHFDHGADGNPVSTDTTVGPIRQQQWISGIQPTPWEGNPAGYSPGAGIRLWGRFAVIDANDENRAASSKSREHWVLQGRDAFSGIPLWTIPRDKAIAQKRWSLVADFGEVYAWLDHSGPLTALDIATGKPLRTYAGTDLNRSRLSGETVCIRATSEALIVGLRDVIICFDRLSGKERWRASQNEKLLLGPVVDAGAGRVYCLLVNPGERKEYGGRWPHSTQVEAMLAISLRDGSTLWTCKAVASRDIERTDKGKTTTTRRGPGQIIPAGKRIIVFGSAAISGGERPYIASIDADSGALLHESDEPFARSYNVASYNVLVRDGSAWFAGAFTNLWKFDPGTGKTDRVLNYAWNQRCTRFTATTQFFIFGQTAFFDSDMAGQQVCVARSGCAMGSIPANGLLYFTPTSCSCITQVRGFQAMSSDPAPPTIADEIRLTQGDGKAPGLPVSLSSRSAPGPIAEDWPKQWRAASLETEPVQAGNVQLVAVVHQHRIEARRDGKAIWAFTAGGRISAPPVVRDGAAVFGSHDGCVYSIRIRDGAHLWKYQLAPADRLICVNGQLESSWPVYGVCLDATGRIIASAGTHVELDGGVTIAALDPGTGEPAWIKRLQKQPSVIPAGGGKGAVIAAHSFINSVPRIEEGKIVLGDGGRKGGTFAFSENESAQSLNERLSMPTKK